MGAIEPSRIVAHDSAGVELVSGLPWPPPQDKQRRRDHGGRARNQPDSGGETDDRLLAVGQSPAG